MDLSNLMSGLGGGSVDPNQPTGAVQDLFTQQGGVDGLVNALKSAGLEDQVNSWISTGSNQPVDANQLAGAIGPDKLQALSSKTGLPVEQLLPLLVALLPQIIDFLTPGGQLPPGGGTGSVNDIGSIIGSVLGSGGLGSILGGMGGGQSGQGS